MKNLEYSQQVTKVKQLADSIAVAISKGDYPIGSALPSINKLSVEFGMSRDTVFKALNDLKKRNLIDSESKRGYYVINNQNTVLLLLDTYSYFKEALYNGLRNSLPYNYQIDLFFHQYSERLFNSTILDNVGLYTHYLVMNYNNDSFSESLTQIDPARLLLLDFGNFEKNDYSYICQDFNQDFYNCLNEGVKLFKKHQRLCLVIHYSSEHPKSCIPYFIRFCEENSFEYTIIQNELKEEDICLHTAYLIVRHLDLIEFVKICKRKQFVIGKNIGVVAFNDAPMLEVIGNGITSISIDFKAMGYQAARFVRDREKIQTYLPVNLIRRGSL